MTDLTEKARIVAERIMRMRRARTRANEPERVIIAANLAHATRSLRWFNRVRHGRSTEGMQ